MVSARTELERELVRRIQPVARQLRAVADVAMASLGLSDATGWALLHVYRAGPDTSQVRLAAMMGISAPSLVRLLGQLAQRGLVRRDVDEADRRLNRISLMPEGRSVAEQIEERLAPVRAGLFRDFADDELAIAVRLLAALDRQPPAEPEPRP